MAPAIRLKLGRHDLPHKETTLLIDRKNQMLIDNRTISTTSPTNTSRARVGKTETNTPTSTTTSTSQRQRGQDSTCDSELGKLVGARTNNHSTTSSISDTAVYPNYPDPNSSSSGSSMHPRRGDLQDYQDPVERQVRQ